MRVEASVDIAADIEACTPAASLVATLGRWAMRQFTRELRPIGLKPRHHATLLALRRGPLTQQSLGEAVGIDPAQLVGLLNDLETERLVVRRRDPDDRRRHIVEIASLGADRLETTDRAMAAIDARLLAGLSAEDGARFVELLRFVASHGGYDDACDAIETPCASEGGEGCVDAAVVDECPAATARLVASPTTS